MTDYEVTDRDILRLRKSLYDKYNGVVKLIKDKPMGESWIVFEDDSINVWYKFYVYVDGMKIPVEKIYRGDNIIALKYPKDVGLRIKVEIHKGEKPKCLELIKYYIGVLKDLR